MLKEQGTIISVDDDGVWVETIQKSACDSCSVRSGCGQRLLADSVVKNMSHIKAYFSCSDSRIWLVGDRVEIGISEDALVSATLLAYMMPLVLMLLFALLGSNIGDSDAYAIVGAVIGLAFGAFLARWYSFSKRADSRYHAVVLGPSPPLECS